MRRHVLVTPLAVVCVLVAGAGCASKSKGPTGSSALSTAPSPTVTTTPTTPAPHVTVTATVATTVATTAAAPDWPIPEDCITYNPGTVTVSYEAGIFSVSDGSTVVMLLHGDPGGDVGKQGVALAQRYHKHCFIGRGNTREEKHSYIFDYWRSPSGNTPTIPDQSDICSPYDRHNLTVEDMGGGDGWRVKDHDHVLQLFDNESDARNGKLVLAKYGNICFIGDSTDVDPDQVSYMH